MSEEKETFENVLHSIRSTKDCASTDPGYRHIQCRYAKDWCKRLKAAHERAMVQTAERIALSKSEKFESMEKMIPRLKATIKKIVDDNSRLRDALKPVLECPRICFMDIVNGNSRDAINAVRKAKSIYKKGGVK